MPRTRAAADAQFAYTAHIQSFVAGGARTANKQTKSRAKSASKDAIHCSFRTTLTYVSLQAGRKDPLKRCHQASSTGLGVSRLRSRARASSTSSGRGLLVYLTYLGKGCGFLPECVWFLTGVYSHTLIHIHLHSCRNCLHVYLHASFTCSSLYRQARRRRLSSG